MGLFHFLSFLDDSIPGVLEISHLWMVNFRDQAGYFNCSFIMRHVEAIKVKSLQVGDLRHSFVTNRFSLAGVDVNEGRQPHSLPVPRTGKFHLLKEASLAWVCDIV